MKPVTAGSVLVLQSDTKLPIELEMERQARAALIKPAKFDLSDTSSGSRSLPDVAHSGTRRGRQRGGAPSTPSGGAVVDQESSSLRVRRDRPPFVRCPAFDGRKREFHQAYGWHGLSGSDPDGNLLGPAHATQFGFGDVEGFDSKLTGSSAFGRGAMITNRPLATQAAFDQTQFEGDLPAGWEAELYRNDELLAFAKPTSDQRYIFDNVQLLYGENRIRIVLYGPQGQVRTREETINVGQDNAPPGKTWYWVGFNEPNLDIISLEKPPDGQDLPTAVATTSRSSTASTIERRSPRSHVRC